MERGISRGERHGIDREPLCLLSFLLSSLSSSSAPYRCCRREAAASLLAASRAPSRAASAGGSSMRKRWFCSLSLSLLRKRREKTNEVETTFSPPATRSLSFSFLSTFLKKKKEAKAAQETKGFSLCLFSCNQHQSHGPDPRRRGGSTEQQLGWSSGSRMHLHELGIAFSSSPSPPQQQQHLPSLLRPRRLRRLLRAALDFQRRQR